MFQAKEEELLVKQEKILSIKADIEKLGDENGFKPKYVKSGVTTSFMTRKSVASN